MLNLSSRGAQNAATLSSFMSGLGATAIQTDYTDAINWGDQVVDSGQYNANGDMVIEYYFEPAVGNYNVIFPRLEWTDYEKQQVAAAFDTYEAVINVEFVETTVAADAEFDLNKINSHGLFLGAMNPPGTNNPGAVGFDGSSTGLGFNDTGGLEQGGYGFVTLIHEFGHGMGLAHPHDTGGGSPILPGVSNSNDTGTFDLNQGVYTMMSYIDGWATNPDGAMAPSISVNYGYEGTPMAVDIAELQDKYGANMDYHTGDDVYYLPDADAPGTFYSSIWDAGGNDTIQYDGSSDAIIDLRDASLLIEEGGGGWISYAEGVHGGYTIANGVSIENATGGSGNDALVANEADNILTGNAGADTFIFTADGGGSDTVADFENNIDKVDISDLHFFHNRADFHFSIDTSGVTIEYQDQTILIADMDRSELSFSDFVFFG